MRGMTLAVVGAAVAVLVAIAVLMRGGDETQSPASGVGVSARPRIGGGTSPGGPADPAADSHSARVEDRLGQLRAEYDKRKLEDTKPAVGQREAPTASAKAEKMRERAEKELGANDADADDPEEIAEARDTLLNNEDPDERIGAIMLLTGDEGPESMQLLMETLDDPDAEVRLAAVEALGDRVEDLTPGLLVKPLRDPDAEVRFEAVSVLGDMEDPDALQLVKAALQDPDDDVRALAEGIMDFADDDTTTQHGDNQQSAN